MTIYGRWREARLKSELLKREELYNNSNFNNIAEYQLKKFNNLWSQIQKHVPFYKKLYMEGHIPSEIKTWNDFLLLPVQTRALVKQKINLLQDSRKKPDCWPMTGGSTGTPIKFPRWNTEVYFTDPDHWYGRSLYGVKRSDKLFLLWGHSHLLGQGKKRIIKSAIRKMKDTLLGYYRFSAYNLTQTELMRAGEQILKYRPNYIIGYSKALHMLAKINIERSQKFHSLNLKAVIGAAEALDSVNDEKLISEVFGCPFGYEYGSIETIIMAHTYPNGGYKVFWDNNLLEAVDLECGKTKILVTSLYPRAFPLIRYDIGDVVIGAILDGKSVVSFERVLGRDNDLLFLDENTPMHSELFTHAIECFDEVISFQVHQSTDGQIKIELMTKQPLSNERKHQIKLRLMEIDKRLGRCKIKCVTQMKQTIAGKTRWIIRD